MKKLLFLLQLIIPSLLIAQIAGYESQNIEGFEVYVELDALNNHPAETNEAIALLTTKLGEILDFELKEEIVDELQLTKIFMDWNTTTGAAVYHPSLQWLIDNGYIEEKWKSIEISNITNFINWTELNQPFMVMHELAHAYHDKAFGFSYAPIINSYDNAMQNNLYDAVLYHAGNGVYTTQTAYATTNAIEYFAEITEAYLGENDYFPFTADDLESHDPMGYAVVVAIWEFENGLNVSENNIEGIALYPNPTTGILTIKWSNTWRPQRIRIIATDGKIVLEHKVNTLEDTTLNISSFSSGMYTLVLDDKKVYKVIKMN